MANFYVQKQQIDIMNSHAQAVTQVAGAARTLGDASKRGVQLWAMATALSTQEEATAAGKAFATEATAQFNANKVHLVTAIDAVALSTGMTRQQILDALAAMPATSFE